MGSCGLLSWSLRTHMMNSECSRPHSGNTCWDHCGCIFCSCQHHILYIRQRHIFSVYLFTYPYIYLKFNHLRPEIYSTFVIEFCLLSAKLSIKRAGVAKWNRPLKNRPGEKQVRPPAEFVAIKSAGGRTCFSPTQEKFRRGGENFKMCS